MKGKVKRKDVFVTTKIWVENMGYESTLCSFQESLSELKLDTVDLLLVHWPGDFGRTTDPVQCREKRRETWRAMEQLLAEKQVKFIGVANYGQKHLEDSAGVNMGWAFGRLGWE